MLPLGFRAVFIPFLIKNRNSVQNKFVGNTAKGIESHDCIFIS